MELTVYGPLRGVTGEKQLSVAVPDADPTVRQVLETLAETYPRAEPQLFASDGTIQGSVRVLVDGEAAELDAVCPSNATVSVMPAMRGGRGPVAEKQSGRVDQS